jgi:hypothetical protein
VVAGDFAAVGFAWAALVPRGDVVVFAGDFFAGDFFAVPDFGAPGAPGFGAPDVALRVVPDFARPVRVVPEVARPVLVPPARPGCAVLACGDGGVVACVGDAGADDSSEPPRILRVT